MAINGSRSDFQPINGVYSIDTFREVSDLTENEVTTDIPRWKELKAKTNRTSAEESEFNTLTAKLASKTITSEEWNLLLDAMYNLEQAYVEKGLDQIETTVEDYVENYAQEDINAKLGTKVNNLLLTDATRVIISTAQPTVVNGALWIKPKTT